MNELAQEYIQIKEKDEGPGLIALSKGVFETIAQISIDDVDQAYAIEPTTLKKPIQCKIANNRLNVMAEIKVKYGANVNAVCETLQDRIYQNILQMTSLKCNLVDVKVVGFLF